MQKFILMGHSFGGMVVKLMLHQHDLVLANMTQAVTVASPFYGYDGQIHRWFEGEPLLNQIGPFDVTAPMIKVITSLPGGYVLPYLDYQTWLTNHRPCGSGLPPSNYPSKDAGTGQPVDPFNPGRTAIQPIIHGVRLRRTQPRVDDIPDGCSRARGLRQQIFQSSWHSIAERDHHGLDQLGIADRAPIRMHLQSPAGRATPGTTPSRPGRRAS